MGRQHRHLVAAVVFAVATAGLAGCGGDDDEAAEATPTPTIEASPTPSPTPTPEPTPSSVQAKGKGFTIRLPGEPERSQQFTTIEGSKITFDVLTYDDGDQVYSVTRVRYPTSVPITTKGALDSAAEQADGRLSTSRTFRFRGEEAIEGTILGAKADGKKVVVFARYVLVGRVLYGMVFVDKTRSKGEPSQAFTKFAGSLRLT